MKDLTMKTILRLLLVALCVFSFAPSVALAQTSEGGFTEEFDAERLEGWEHTPEIALSDGVLRLYGGNFVFKLGSWGDQEIRIRLRLGSIQGAFLIHYFATDNGSYNLVFTPESVRLEKAAGPDNVLNFGEIANTIPVDTWLELIIRVEGGQHTITLDDETILTADDPDPFQSGTVGFNNEGVDVVEIDSVQLSPIGETDANQPEVDEPELAAPTAVPTQVPGGSLLDTLQDFLQPQRSQIDLLAFMINLVLSVILAFILGRVYIYWGGSLSNRRKFAANFMLITITTTFIILVVRSSVALSLGLVGALSIVRFRTAVKEPEELAYLFLAIAIGIGLGDNQRLITILAFAVVILIIGLLRLFRQSGADVNLHLTVASHNPEKLSLDQLMNALKPHTAKLKLLRMDESQTTAEFAFLVEFKHIDDLNLANKAVHSLAPEASMTFLDNKGIW